MNNIITLKKLVEILGKATGMSLEKTNQFVMAYTSLISETLAKGEAVKVKGVGTFTIVAGKIDFIPDEELSEAVNAPFSMFLPEPLDPATTESQLQNAAVLATELSEPETNNSIEPHLEPEPEATELSSIEEPTIADIDLVVESEPLSEPEVDSIIQETEVETATVNLLDTETEPESPKNLETAKESEPTPITEPTKQPELETETQSKSTSQPVPLQEVQDEAMDMSSENQASSHSFPILWTVWGLVIGCLLGILFGFFAHDPIQEWLEPTLTENVDEQEELQAEIDALTDIFEAEPNSDENASNVEVLEPVEISEPIKEAVKEEPTKTQTPVETKSEPQVVYDVIQPGITLNSLAKKHYGEKVYWVYIYMENKSKISNPDLIPVNTKLVIPPLSKYATQSTDAQKREAANKLAGEILSKKKK